jgi:hypothetical protein
LYRPGICRSSDKPNDLSLRDEYEDAARARLLFLSSEFLIKLKHIEDLEDGHSLLNRIYCLLCVYGFKQGV